MVGRYLMYPGDNGHDSFEFGFSYHRGLFFVGGDISGGDSSTMGNVCYT